MAVVLLVGFLEAAGWPLVIRTLDGMGFCSDLAQLCLYSHVPILPFWVDFLELGIAPPSLTCGQTGLSASISGTSYPVDYQTQERW